MTSIRISRIRLVTLACAVALVLPFLSAPAEASGGLETDFACRVNAARTSDGQSRLRVASDLTRVARDHSKVMADRSLLHHNPNLGQDVSSWLVVAENVGRGGSVASLHDAFMRSTGHRANILDGRVTEMGIGVVQSGSTIWVTQVFRQPRSTSSAPFPSCGGSTTSASPLTGGIPVVGDWNGDGRVSPGRFRDGTWTLTNPSGTSVWRTVQYGSRGDLPVVGDWNGNGRDTLGIIRDGDWHLRNDLNGGPGTITFRFGRVTQGDVPVVGDWNGNGRDTIGIIRDGDWHLRHSLSGGPGQTVFRYGRVLSGDIPVIGDFNGSGRDGVGIVRGHDWHLRNSLSGGDAQKILKL